MRDIRWAYTRSSISTSSNDLNKLLFSIHRAKIVAYLSSSKPFKALYSPLPEGDAICPCGRISCKMRVQENPMEQEVV